MTWGIWITGPPGSGKSAVAREAAAMFHASGADVSLLELDELRQLWTPAPTYSEAERELVYRALAELAALLVDAGTPVLIDATAHRRAWRDHARDLIPRFAEVQVVCPLEVCRAREAARRDSHAPRGIYAHAGEPGARVPGVDVPYEPALSPHLVLDTVALQPAEAAAKVVALGRRLADISPKARRATLERGGALWITGRPGSGKTTLARGVADRLLADGIEPRILELRVLRRALLGDRFAGEAEEELVHRVLASMARALVTHGGVVIVDATTPRRAWRELARRAIPVFAEIHLVCPAELSAERERAARWNLGPAIFRGTPAPAPGGPPEICLDYEESATADLTLDTRVETHWRAVERTIRLAARLLRGDRKAPDSPQRRAP